MDTTRYHGFIIGITPNYSHCWSAHAVTLVRVGKVIEIEFYQGGYKYKCLCNEIKQDYYQGQYTASDGENDKFFFWYYSGASGIVINGNWREDMDYEIWGKFQEITGI